VKQLALAFALAGCTHPASPTPRAPSHVACSAEPALDYTRLVGVKVARVDVRGVGIDAATAAAQLDTKPGTVLDPDKLRGDVRRLWQLHAASQVAVTAQPGADGYAIEVALTPPPRVRAVEIDGVPRDQLAALTILEGTLHDEARLERLAAAATEWWRAHGYLHAEITAQARLDCDAHGVRAGATVVVHVQASLGRRYMLAYLGVTGSALPAPAAIFERDLGAANRVGAPYRESDFVEDLQALAQRHRSAGWLDVDIRDFASHVDEARGVVTASAHVVPGERYKLAPPTITGGTAAQRAVVERELAPLVGRYYDEDAVDDASNRAFFQLSAQGLQLVWVRRHEHGRYLIDLTLKENSP
jgi:outer membrane protein assembly factor BamA